MAEVQDLYLTKLKDGELQSNPAQAAAVEILDTLATAVDRKVKARARSLRRFGAVRWLSTLLFGQRVERSAQWVYLHGPVGRGKTLVMDLFVDATQAMAPRVHRTHFHQFFAGVHSKIHHRRAEGLSTEDVMTTLAHELARQHDVLAFDEFYVNNIADAMILGRFLDALFNAGVTIIFTSNDAPSSLYDGGLQRERFVPTIELIRNKSKVVYVDTGTDYRLLQRRLPSTFTTPLGDAATRFLDACLSELTGDEPVSSLTLYLDGNRLVVPEMAGGFARFGFADLCERPLGRSEYLGLAREFKGLLLADVPAFVAYNRDATERFRIFVDIWYDQGRFLALSAEMPLEQLITEPDDHARMARTISRLIEMQSPAYVQRALGHGQQQ